MLESSFHSCRGMVGLIRMHKTPNKSNAPDRYAPADFFVDTVTLFPSQLPVVFEPQVSRCLIVKAGSGRDFPCHALRVFIVYFS